MTFLVKILSYSQHQLQVAAKLTTADLQEIQHRRRAHNCLGFAYQLTFVRLANAFRLDSLLNSTKSCSPA